MLERTTVLDCKKIALRPCYHAYNYDMVYQYVLESLVFVSLADLRV